MHYNSGAIGKYFTYLAIVHLYTQKRHYNSGAIGKYFTYLAIVHSYI